MAVITGVPMTISSSTMSGVLMAILAGANEFDLRNIVKKNMATIPTDI